MKLSLLFIPHRCISSSIAKNREKPACIGQLFKKYKIDPKSLYLVKHSFDMKFRTPNFCLHSYHGTVLYNIDSKQVNTFRP